MPPSKDDAILQGPKSPTWSCGCGQAGNFACRIRCRGCNRDAPARIRTSAEKANKESVAVPKVSAHPQPRGYWQQSAPKDQRLRKLEARLKSLESENSSLRVRTGDAEAKELETRADLEGETDASLDPTLLQAVLEATVNAYGIDSKQAKEKTEELEAARAARRQAKPASAQMRVAERRVHQQRKALEKARTFAEAAASALREAQAAAAEALEKVAAAEKRLHEAEAEQQICCQRSIACTNSLDASASEFDGLATVAALSQAFADDAESLQALQLVRTKLEARAAPPPGTETAKASTHNAEPSGVEQAAVSSQRPDGADVDDMDLDDEAIDGIFDILTPEDDDNSEQFAAFLAAAKAKCKVKRRDVASQISGVRKRLKK